MSEPLAPFLLAFQGTTAPDTIRDAIERHEAAGVTLFHHHNVVSPDQVRELTDELRSAATAMPPLIAIDQEGGQLRGLGPASTAFAGNLALGAVDDTELTTAVGRAIGSELRAVGINVDYAPVADLATNPANAAMGTRSFGDDPASVARHVAAFVEGLRAAGVASTLKHLPGIGHLAADTHHGAATIARTAEEVRSMELAPFRAGIDAGAELVMSGHAAAPSLSGSDDLPATLSSAVLGDLLRDELGFAGVTVSDAFDMAALDQGDGIGLDAVAALVAGIDLLLLPPDDTKQRRIVETVRHAARRELLPARRLASAQWRVDELRRRLAVHEPLDVSIVGCRRHLDLADELARRSVTLVRDDAGLLPLRRDVGRVVVVQPRPTNVTPADVSSGLSPELAAAFRRVLPEVDEFVVPHSPTNADIGAVVRAAAGADRVIVAVSHAWHVPGQVDLVGALRASGSEPIVLALRDPADVSVLPEARTLVCTYSQLRPSLDAASAAVVGDEAFVGRLPVRLASRERGAA